MNVTVEMLNAIPGRPEWMQPWSVRDEIAEHQRFKSEDVGCWTSSVTMYLSVCCPCPHVCFNTHEVSVQVLFDLATYGKAIVDALREMQDNGQG